MAEGRAQALRLSLYWGDRLLDVRQVEEGRAVGPSELFGLNDQQLSFSDGQTLELGGLTLCAEALGSVARVGSLGKPDDFSFLKTVIIASMVFVAVMVSLMLTPRSMAADDEEVIRTAQDIAHKFIPTKMFSPPAAAPKAKGAEGAAGDKKVSAKKPPQSKATKTADQKRAEVFNLLPKFDGPAGRQVFGDGVPNWAVQADHLQNGTASVDGHGMAGIGARHSGPGGGGDDPGLHIGSDLGIKGGSDVNGVALTPGRHLEAPADTAKRVIVDGGLTREEIAKVIKLHQSAIKYCYETQLQRSPELAGKVAVSFTIDPTGSVSDAAVSESSLNNESAEQCMLASIRRWKFPEPRGGGVVTVNFPWVFSRSP